jgi:hypothetical protein
MTDKTAVASLKTRDVTEMKDRRDLFKQVAVATLSSRPALVVASDADGPKVSEHFIKTVSIITDGIIEAAHKFGEK